MRVVDKARVGQNIRAARERAGMSVKELAAESGVSTFSIYDFEREKARSLPRLDTALLLADTLGITLSELIGERVVVEEK